jgi:UDP-N-acetylglucosamine--N-acetylmuramyl-(pentapeptide) pyrophosphoryl-undecaprenol N-acetylglucosamine transferase
MKKIFVTGGGTGGHLFPAIALGEELVSRGYDVHLVTDTRCKGYLKDCTLKTHLLHLGFMRKGLMSKILLSTRMIFAIAQSIALLICYRPQVVVGFGGYTAFPMMLAAKLLYIPIMLHEQNCFLGKVNDMFARTCFKLALNFAETTNLPTNIEGKLVIAGNPIRKELRAISPSDAGLRGSQESQDPPRPAREGGAALHLLVIGGSQGAKIFSSVVPAAIDIALTKNPKAKLRVTQQAKAEDIEDIKKIYTKLGITAEVQAFFHNMSELYSGANLVICRSGASTIAELIHLGKPAIFIPFPGAAEDHQTFNAKVIESKEAGWMLEEPSTTPEILADKILHLATNPEELDAASLKLSKLRIASERILGDAVEEIINS